MNDLSELEQADPPLLPWRLAVWQLGVAAALLCAAKYSEFYNRLNEPRGWSAIRWGWCLALAAGVFWWGKKLSGRSRMRHLIGVVFWSIAAAVLINYLTDHFPRGQLQLERINYFLLAAAAAVYLPVAYLIALAVRGTGKNVPRRQALRMRIGLWLLIPLFLIAAAMPFYMSWEAGQLIVSHETLVLPGWDERLRGLRVAVLADLHLRNSPKDLRRLRRIVALTNREECDLVLLLGDYSGYGYPSSLDASPGLLARELGELRARIGIFAVLGNHDFPWDREEFRREFSSAGITLLDGEYATLKIKDCPLRLVGFRGEIRHGRILDNPADKWPGDSVSTLVLSHAPDYFPLYPERFSLMISGHTHGGQVDLPWLGPVAVPSQFGSRYLRGAYEREDGGRLFVGVGTGYVLLPWRFRCMPEISVLTLE